MHSGVLTPLRTHGTRFVQELADYWVARGDAGAAERVIGSADPAEPFGCVLLSRLTELLLQAEPSRGCVGSVGKAGADGNRSGLDVDELVLAYQGFATMGADGLRRAAGRRLRALGAKVPRARTRSAGLLTETEDRIARLVRQGMRNREIAATLQYTPRSVEVSLSRIYAKLGISSRLALARMLDTTDRLG